MNKTEQVEAQSLLASHTETPLYHATSSNQNAFNPTSPTEAWFVELLKKADINVNGQNAWDPQVHNPALWQKILTHGSIGLGEAYMHGWWDCDNLEEFTRRILCAELDRRVRGRRIIFWQWLQAKLYNRQSVKRAYQVGEQHYDVGNDLYQAMLDPTMAYSCGYWKETDNLHQAQLNKLRLICEKIHLQQDESVLEIGCGWGSFAELAAREYGARITGITISKEQVKLAETRCKDLPVDIKLQDYRSLEGQYDKAVSIGMFEHVGPKNYDTYMKHVHRLMREDGIFLLHTIGSDQTDSGTDPWIDKYIFPNGVIPSLTEISAAVEPYFVIEDVQNFGQDYANTLLAWHRNFANNWETLNGQYNHTFYRMWSYYLKVCAGAFQSRSLQLYQVVLRKRHKLLGRYQSPR